MEDVYIKRRLTIMNNQKNYFCENPNCKFHIECDGNLKLYYLEPTHSVLLFADPNLNNIMTEKKSVTREEYRIHSYEKDITFFLCSNCKIKYKSYLSSLNSMDLYYLMNNYENLLSKIIELAEEELHRINFPDQYQDHFGIKRTVISAPLNLDYKSIRERIGMEKYTYLRDYSIIHKRNGDLNFTDCLGPTTIKTKEFKI